MLTLAGGDWMGLCLGLCLGPLLGLGEQLVFAEGNEREGLCMCSTRLGARASALTLSCPDDSLSSV